MGFDGEKGKGSEGIPGCIWWYDCFDKFAIDMCKSSEKRIEGAGAYKLIKCCSHHGYV
jgi:hypothetical protein